MTDNLLFCEHEHRYFISSSRGTGCGITERSTINVCLDCGAILVFAEVNGQMFKREFHIHNSEPLEAMWKWVTFVNQNAEP